MQYGRLTNDVLEFMPTSGYLKNGDSVIGYDTLMLANDELRVSEGWLPISYADKPPINENQYLAESYSVVNGEIQVAYEIKDMVTVDNVNTNSTGV